ncbi:hypothetical protein PQX77_020219 [Marasmius sp. AFHP31]|nr:hypothetical protein PQX77_020219 [Marasmius sp. AFHP31]
MKRKTSHNITSEHRSKQACADELSSPNAVISDISQDGPSTRRAFDPDGESEIDELETDGERETDTDNEQDMEDELEVPSYEFSMIVEHQRKDNVLQFKVRWSGYGVGEDFYQGLRVESAA